ncbi:MAG TPA: hypothetical protein VNR00_11750, partial [Opitutus sp.]|nr:hypothetical protein [Opitutus sp.]
VRTPKIFVEVRANPVRIGRPLAIGRVQTLELRGFERKPLRRSWRFVGHSAFPASPPLLWVRAEALHAAGL